jgi:hypothetical protein
MSLPLKGFKVVEFCHVAAGPFCGMFLGGMGAEAIKVELSDGDTMRQWRPHLPRGAGVAACMSAICSGPLYPVSLVRRDEVHASHRPGASAMVASYRLLDR